MYLVIQQTLVLSVSVSSLIIVSQYNVVYCDTADISTVSQCRSLIIVSQYNVVYCDTADISTVSQCQFIDNCLTVQCSVL